MNVHLPRSTRDYFKRKNLGLPVVQSGDSAKLEQVRYPSQLETQIESNSLPSKDDLNSGLVSKTEFAAAMTEIYAMQERLEIAVDGLK